MVVENSEIGGSIGSRPAIGATGGDTGTGAPSPGGRPLDRRRRWLAQADTVVTSRVTGGATIIRVVGELDAVSGPRLWRSVQAAFHRGQGVVVIDLTGTVFLDSFG